MVTVILWCRSGTKHVYILDYITLSSSFSEYARSLPLDGERRLTRVMIRLLQKVYKILNNCIWPIYILHFHTDFNTVKNLFGISAISSFDCVHMTQSLVFFVVFCIVLFVYSSFFYHAFSGCFRLESLNVTLVYFASLSLFARNTIKCLHLSKLKLIDFVT